MLITFLSWFGGYILLGMVASLVNIRELIDWVKDPTEDVYKELCSTAVALIIGWPIVVPMLGYLMMANNICTRFTYKTNKKHKAQVALFRLLAEAEAISEDSYYDSVKKTSDRTNHLIAKKRKKFGIGS